MLSQPTLRHRIRLSADTVRGTSRLFSRTITGSPTLTVSKYHSASGAQADAAVADVLVAERINCPRRRMNEKASAGDPDGVIHRQVVAVGSIDGNADAGRIHHHRTFLGQHRVGVDRRRVIGPTHRGRNTPGSPSAGGGAATGSVDGGSASTPSTVTVNVWAEMSATPTTAGPVAKFVARPPTDSATVLCAGQNRSGTHCTTLFSSHSYLPVIAGADFISIARWAASRFATGAVKVTTTGCAHHHLARCRQNRRDGELDRLIRRRQTRACRHRNHARSDNDHRENTPNNRPHGSYSRWMLRRGPATASRPQLAPAAEGPGIKG